MSPTIHRTQLDYRPMACIDKRIIGLSRKSGGLAEYKNRRRIRDGERELFNAMPDAGYGRCRGWIGVGVCRFCLRGSDYV